MFTEAAVSKIGRMTTAGALTEYPLAAHADPEGIAAGPDVLYGLPNASAIKIGRMTTSGNSTSTQFPRQQADWDRPAGPTVLFVYRRTRKSARCQLPGLLRVYRWLRAPERDRNRPRGALWSLEATRSGESRPPECSELPGGCRHRIWIIAGPDGALCSPSSMTRSGG